MTVSLKHWKCPNIFLVGAPMFCGHGGCNDPSEQPGPSPHQCLPGRPQSPLEYLHICHIHVCVFIGGWVLLPMVGQRGPQHGAWQQQGRCWQACRPPNTRLGVACTWGGVWGLTYPLHRLNASNRCPLRALVRQRRGL